MAMTVVNRTQSSLTKVAPVEALEEKQTELAEKYNKRRGKDSGVKIKLRPLKIGESVRLQVISDKKRGGEFFKAYKAESWSKRRYKVLQKRGNRYKLQANGKKFYIRILSTEFKKRVSKHKTDFKIRKYENSTELSKYIWQLKDKNEKFSLSWKIINRSRSLRNGDKACRLCIKEAALILQAGKDHLNKRKEITSTCRHRKKHLLANYL